MARVIKQAPRKEKKRVCEHCKRTIGFFEDEVKEVHDSDPWGFTDHYTYVKCPGCKERMVIKQY